MRILMKQKLGIHNMNRFKKGYKQAKIEVRLGLKPKCVWEFNLFWIGYSLAVIFKK